jgi:hypothetical protein
MHKPFPHSFRHAVLSWFVTALLSIPFWLMGLTAVRAAGLEFSSVETSGSNLIVTGSGGVPGATYYALASTNLALSPVTSWNRIATNVFPANGQFTNNILIVPSLPQEFIIIATTMPVTISSGLTVANKTYDGTTTATISSNNVTLNGVLPADTGNVTLVTNGYVANFSSANVGTNIAVTVSGLTLAGSAATNYTLTQPVGLTANITAPPPPPGLVAAYPFDEGSGTTVTDVSGNGNNGTVSGATWTTSGKYGHALVFNGTSALVTVNNSTKLQLSNAMTLEAWVNPGTVSSIWQDVIYKGNDNYYLEGTSGNGSVPAMGGTFGGSDVVLYGPAAPLLNTWTHLAGTYDGTTMRFYVNGTQVATQPQTGAISTSTDPLQIGGDTIYNQYFQGTIDEVRIYNVALSAAQIQTDMNTPVGNIPTAPGSLTGTLISTNQVDLNWTASTGKLGVTGYLVERQGPGSTNFVQIGTTSSIGYADDTNLVLNTNYTYRVRATDASGDLGPYSTVVVYTGLSISPSVARLTFTQTQQFTVNVSNVTWSVDGVTGGSVSSGTISGQGLYSPPASVGTHSVTATSSNLSESTSATVYVLDYPGTFTYHNDNFRTGQNLNETVLTPANVNKTSFGMLFSYPLDGLSLASPLYVPNVNIPGQGFHNVVYAATEHDSVYAFDADGLSSAPLWQVSFINPGAGVTTVPAADTGETEDIPNEIGITSTPVIDPLSGTIYVVAKTKEVSGSTTSYVHRLHALDIATGVEKFGGPVVIQGSVAGNAPGSSSGQLPFVPLIENQRTALLLANGVVYFGFGSHGDNGTYSGWVMGYNATNVRQQTLIYNAAPNVNQSGIWMDGDGLAADSAGILYFITGEGPFDGNTIGTDYGDCFMKISTNGAVLDYFSPSVQTTLDEENLDLGAGGELLLPVQPGSYTNEMVGAGKNGTIYLVNRDNMGHYNPSTDQIIQELVDIFANSLGQDGGNFSSPVYFNGRVYFGPVAGAVQAFTLNNGLLSTTPTSHSAEVYEQRGATMAISASGNTNGILWTLQSNGETLSGTLHAYDATNLGNELYTSDQAGSRDTLDAWYKFSVPLVANGKVYVSSVSQLTVYGLLP